MIIPIMQELTDRQVQFRNGDAKLLDPLKRWGFERHRELERDTSMLSEIIFVGKHLALVFSYDIRDTVVDGYVASVVDGNFDPPERGGRFKEIYNALVQKGYRGSSAGTNYADPPGYDSVQLCLIRYLNLLRTAG